jgi:hypothetical protein
MRQIADRMHASYVLMENLTTASILKTFHGFREQGSERSIHRQDPST